MAGVQHGSLPRPLPCRQVKERARRGARRPPPFPRPCPPLGLRFLSSLHFVSVSAHGRLMEGRIHRPLYPARPVSWALLLAFATGFGVPPFSSSPHTFRRRLGCGRVCNKSFDFWTHIDPLKVGALGPASMVEGLQCLGGPVVLGLFDENTGGDRGSGQKEDLQARWLNGTEKMVAHQEISGVVKIKTAHLKCLCYSLKIKGVRCDPIFKSTMLDTLRGICFTF